MNEEIEIKVKEVEGAATKAGTTLVEGLRKLLLASIGVAALTRDEVESFVNKLVDRGELAQKDAEKLLKEMQTRVRESRPQVQKVGERVEQGVEEFLSRLSIPSRRDVDELSAKLDQLSARVDELRKRPQ